LLVEFNAISSTVYKVILSLLQLYNKIIILPPNKMLDKILESPKYNTLLDCISVIDGIYLPIAIKGKEDTQVL
jgi:hypothetical protein